MTVRTSTVSEYTDGWLIGDFTPSFVRSKDFEIALKKVHAGTTEPPHYQKEATEITLLVSGSCELGGVRMAPGDLIEIVPGEVAEFMALEDAVLVCIKFPSLPNDKAMAGQN